MARHQILEEKRSAKAQTEESPLRIVHIAAPGPVGGLESVVIGLAAGHRRRGLETEVVAVLGPDPEETPFVEALRKEGVPTRALRMPHRAYLRERREIRAFLEERRPDVVHPHGHRPVILDSGLVRAMGIPTVTTVHGSSHISWRTELYEWVKYRVFRKFDAVVPVSRSLLPDLDRAGVPRDRIHVIPNAWDGRVDPLPRPEARQVLNLPPDAFVFGWVGRLIPVKGPDVFLKALGLLDSRGFLASIVGDGSERRHLEDAASDLGIADRVRFHGRLGEASRLFRAFDVFVLSSRSEAAPMVLFEAMAAGVPIVATEAGGVGEILSPAEAVLVPPEDPELLAASLRRVLLGQEDLERKVSAAARRLAVDFATDRWLDRYEEIYRKVAGRRVAKHASGR